MLKKKYLVIATSASLILASGLGAYIYIDETYVCDGFVDTETYFSSSAREEKSSYKLSFSFGWNQLTKKMQLSSIDELSSVSFDIDVHYAAVEDSREHDSHITNDSMGVYFHSGFRTPKKIENGIPYGSNSQITFDKKSKFIVVNKSYNMQFGKDSLSNKVKVSGKCVRQWSL